MLLGLPPQQRERRRRWWCVTGFILACFDEASDLGGHGCPGGPATTAVRVLEETGADDTGESKTVRNRWLLAPARALTLSLGALQRLLIIQNLAAATLLPASPAATTAILVHSAAAPL